MARSGAIPCRSGFDNSASLPHLKYGPKPRPDCTLLQSRQGKPRKTITVRRLMSNRDGSIGGAIWLYFKGVILSKAVFQASRRACPERSRRDLGLYRPRALAKPYHRPAFEDFGEEEIYRCRVCDQLLAELDRQLPLWLGHLAPESLQVFLQGLILGFFAQCLGEPAIRGREISGCTNSG